MGSSAEQGSSINSTSGWVATARAMQSRCCWPPDRPVPGSFSRSLTSFHSAAPRSDFSTISSSSARLAGQAVDARAIGHIVIDRLGKGVGFLEHHADAGTQLHRVDALVIDILAVQRDLALDPADVDGVVHAVQAAQEGRLAAARGADEGGDGLVQQVDIHVLDRVLVAIPDLNVAGRDLDFRLLHSALQDSHVVHIGSPSRVYHRRSNLRRRRMASRFMQSRNTSSTMIAPDARSIKAGSARWVQL
ncbi:hypothetical protein SAMN05421641_11177 [Paracoccus thiocyanatus]|uniref:Uncharacterized protein n=1 Tax=Paracoccus thiocyanatus TaxID=34006 RepID=A0A1N6UKA3_9RHOB|nr:hypothetical protein SAMN05421641_11177 [Paracoccus thiocyanatus]